MSWSIYAMGSKGGVKKYVAEIKCAYEADQLAFERARAFLLDEIGRVTSNGVQVEASGHGAQTNVLKVIGQALFLDE